MRIAYICRGIHPAHGILVKGIGPEIVYADLRNILTLLYNRRRYDVLVADGFTALRYAWILKRLRVGKKLVFVTTSHAVVEHRLLSKVMLRQVDGVIATSTYAKSEVEKLGFNGPTIIYHPIPKLTDFLRVETSLDSHRICFLGTLLHHKGADLLPKILSRVREKVPDAEIYAIGSNVIGLKGEVKGLHVFGWLPREKVRNILSQCSIYIHPARSEFFGASVVEAMAAGLIPVVTKSTGARDLVRLVRPDLVLPLDVESISNKIIELLGLSFAEKERLSRKAREVAYQSYMLALKRVSEIIRFVSSL